MAYLVRIALALAVFWSFSAQALPVGKEYALANPTDGSEYSAWFSSKTAAVAGGWAGYSWSCLPSDCERSDAVWSAGGRQGVWLQRSSCPANSSLSGASCVCSSGFIETGGSCSVDNSAANSAAAQTCSQLNAGGTPSGGGAYTSLVVPSHSFDAVYNGVHVSGRVVVKRPDGKYAITGPFRCDTDLSKGAGVNASSENANAPAAGCKPPQHAGTVTANGVTSTICYTPSESTTKSGGTTTSSTTGGSSSGTSSGTEESQTTCGGGSCTTTTTKTTTGPDGAPVSTTTTETKDQPSFCSENPRSPLCVSSSFSGACESPAVCEGDAIQCAVASFTLATKCALTQPPLDSPQLKAYDDALAAQASGDQTGLITVTKSIGAADFDSTNLLGPAADLVDANYSFGFTSFTVPWSKLTAPLKIIGLIAQAVVFLLCARIVLRG